MEKQVKIAAAKYQDQDDSLTAAANDYAQAHGLDGWDLAPRWEDEQRDVIVLTVPSGNVTLNGKAVDFAAAANLMDDEIRETLHAEMGGCSDQEFLDAYVKAHADKFGGEEFQVA